MKYISDKAWSFLCIHLISLRHTNKIFLYGHNIIFLNEAQITSFLDEVKIKTHFLIPYKLYISWWGTYNILPIHYNNWIRHITHLWNERLTFDAVSELPPASLTDFLFLSHFGRFSRGVRQVRLRLHTWGSIVKPRVQRCKSIKNNYHTWAEVWFKELLLFVLSRENSLTQSCVIEKEVLLRLQK